MTQNVSFSASSHKPQSHPSRLEKRAWSMVYNGAIVALTGSLFVLTCGGTLGARLYSHHAHNSLNVDIEEALKKSVSETLGIVLAGPSRGERRSRPQALSMARLKKGLLSASRKQKRSGPPGRPPQKRCVFGDPGRPPQKRCVFGDPGRPPQKRCVFGDPGRVETEREAGKLAAKVFKIRSKIERLAKTGSLKGGIKGLLIDLREAMQSPFYKSIKHTDCEGVNFLQFVAVKLIAADGTEALKNYGKKCLGKLEGDGFGPEDLAGLLSGELAKPGFAYGLLGKPLWIATHPFYAMHSAKSEYDPLGYDASLENPNFSAHSFEMGGKSLKFYYGPGPTGNPIFEHGVLPAYEKLGVFELRFNHQDMSSRNESFRIRELQRIVEENPRVLKHALLGFDTKMKKNKEVEFETPSQFFAAFREYLKKGIRGEHSRENHSGFEIPQSLLSDADLELSLTKAQEFCERLCVENAHWQHAMEEARGQLRMGKMMQIIIDAYLTLAMVVRSLDAMTPEMAKRALDAKLDRDLTALRTSAACKQDVDRGVVENIALRLFFRWTENPTPLTQDEVYEIAGAVLGRARMAADRKILAGRYEILDDLLRFVGSAPSGVSIAHSLLKDFRQTLKTGRGI
jgi:hypothetical protein